MKIIKEAGKLALPAIKIKKARNQWGNISLRTNKCGHIRETKITILK